MKLKKIEKVFFKKLFFEVLLFVIYFTVKSSSLCGANERACMLCTSLGEIGKIFHDQRYNIAILNDVEHVFE